ncbi:MAG: ribosomal protein S18-alanine N-acetyltransferase [Sphingomonas sp.]|uniref:ribosomal protein S18-alanine N-acetyltransferase n=1 Tax=Sphingomonas sp. TaxID=28214 RepID=UPI0018506F28|nr:ribosomal protein S18-alanine N-acetyltransferase [Sphingomonas sp.]MBA3666928.1 ribosomal protein S18-alanine N-acetyltransferase [Sphingomonas sp.]
MIGARPEFAAGAVRLRPGTGHDLDQVMRIMNAAFPPTFGEAWTRSQCAGILPMAGVELILAEKGRACVGFSLARSITEEAELLLIAVDPAAQRQGVGAALLTQFIAATRAAGCHRLHLEVRDGNPAVALYRSAGFVLGGRRRDYYCGLNGDRHDALTLVLAD